jgi:hypothetical protein
LYFVHTVTKVSGVFVRFRAPLRGSTRVHVSLAICHDVCRAEVRLGGHMFPFGAIRAILKHIPPGNLAHLPRVLGCTPADLSSMPHWQMQCNALPPD